MIYLIGEYECKLDTKGRMVVPAALKRQLPDVEREGLVVNRGFDGNLVIYTRNEWNKILTQLSRLNQFQAKNRDFVRKFTSGATELMLDSAGRVLLPRVLLDYAQVANELVLVCNLSKVELWSKAKYEEKMASISEEDFSDLAESVMGDFDLEGGLDV
ncbi:division/cell wall cluster transcriptional repressor MraZ [Sphingobacterium rhinopitheci]|uniref:division/cell wall cluster transcriptional repressor MraZ n=1 Tax=Sphingobacterium rhinopitheci TaxID=2781960 RepID=UPI001F5273F2|nr:division/cell wall cluster transcriptional repressor MraZ [Sphingobacterium rhinopitheci]MCI0921645.1 division/cell wall cluster transcriptional repressor MraZ [Sphingobacterium rhinopitheci]